MDLEKAIKRIENIKKKEPDDYDIDGLVDEYLKGIALFFYKESIPPKNPIRVNIALELGDIERIKLDDYCEIDKDVFNNKATWEYILTIFLQLVRYSENNEKAKEYINIYEPLIKLIEKGIYFTFREGDLWICNATYYPLYGWYDRILVELKNDGLI